MLDLINTIRFFLVSAICITKTSCAVSRKRSLICKQCGKYCTFIYCTLFNHLCRNWNNTWSHSYKSYTLGGEDAYVNSWCLCKIFITVCLLSLILLYYGIRKNVIRYFFPANISISNNSTIIVLLYFLNVPVCYRRSFSSFIHSLKHFPLVKRVILKTFSIQKSCF